MRTLPRTWNTRELYQSRPVSDGSHKPKEQKIAIQYKTMIEKYNVKLFGLKLGVEYSRYYLGRTPPDEIWNTPSSPPIGASFWYVRIRDVGYKFIMIRDGRIEPNCVFIVRVKK